MSAIIVRSSTSEDLDHRRGRMPGHRGALHREREQVLRDGLEEQAGTVVDRMTGSAVGTFCPTRLGLCLMTLGQPMTCHVI